MLNISLASGEDFQLFKISHCFVHISNLLFSYCCVPIPCNSDIPPDFVIHSSFLLDIEYLCMV